MDEQNKIDQLYIDVFGTAPKSSELLPGAGSNRHYYRLTADDDTTVIGCVGTSAEENQAFYHLSLAFAARDFQTPAVYGHSEDWMCYLQEDLGQHSLYDFLKDGRESGGDYDGEHESVLSLVMSQLPQMQFEGGDDYVFSHCYPQREMDRTSVMFDLNYFKYCFLKLSGVEFNEFKLQHDLEAFADSLLQEDADTFLYRDFQARNVMLSEGKPYFIDYQGGRKGPIYYDVASFLWQASAKYPDDLRERLIDKYFNALTCYTEREDCPQCYRNITREHFDARLRQFVFFRLLQVLGAYGFRGLWELKKYFVDSIPAALQNLSQQLDAGSCDEYPYLKDVCHALVEKHLQSQVSPCQANGAELQQSQSAKVDKVASYLAADASYLNTSDDKKPLVVRVNSFSFKRGIPKDETNNGGGYVFDCRSTHNPGRYAEYKPLTGLDKPVIDFLEEDGEILTFLDSVYKLVDFHAQRFIDRGFTDLMISCGCTGGRHRSVYSAQHVAEHLNRKFGVEVHICHREQGIMQVLPSR